MSTESTIYLLICLILPVAALMSRRLPTGRVIVMALAWVGVFAVGLLVVSLVQQNSWLGSSVSSLFSGNSVVGNETRIAMSDDGHFHARVSINGAERIMLIDSGATTIALTPATAKAAGIDVDESPFPVMIDTANGQATGKRATVAHLQVGSITASNLEATVLDGLGDEDILGMNFLSSLKSWRVEGKTLILVPNHK